MGRRSRWVGPPRPQTLPNEGGAPRWTLPLHPGVPSSDFKTRRAERRSAPGQGAASPLLRARPTNSAESANKDGFG